MELGTVLWLYARLYALTALVFFALDLTWIAGVASGFYRRHIGHLLAADVRWGAALLFYVVYIAGIMIFATLPGLEAGSAARAVGLGAFLGLFAYATFDLTALALFRAFPPVVAAVDLAWGTVLTATVSGAGYGLGRWLGAGP